MQHTFRRPLVLLLVLAALASVRTARATDDARPNIVLILADDLSWSDPACYGNPWHETPHLDRLAREGMRFTNAYAPAPICSASRAAILTGKTPARLGFEFVTKNEPGRQTARALQSPPFTLDLPLEETTLAEMLAAGGYDTGFFGKWHLNRHHEGYLGWSPTHGPLAQGFATGSSDFGSHPYGYLKAEGPDHAPLEPGAFPEDTLTDRAIGFLRTPRERPFFLYLSQYYVHDPVQSRAAWLVEKSRRRLPDGAPEVRARYGAMVETLDHLVGRVLDALDSEDLAPNTVVVFTSDNGGHPDHVANGPHRGSKWNLYEGGIRVPLLVRWPGVVAAGRTSDEPVTGCDLFPTFRELATARVDGVPRDGRSLVPLLKDQRAGDDPRALVWHFPYYHPESRFDERPAAIGINDFATSQTRPHSAIRLGRHKLLSFYEDERGELYDLQDDPGEQHDLASAEPERAARLRKRLEGYLSEVAARLPQRAARLRSANDEEDR